MPLIATQAAWRHQAASGFAYFRRLGVAYRNVVAFEPGPVNVGPGCQSRSTTMAWVPGPVPGVHGPWNSKRLLKI